MNDVDEGGDKSMKKVILIGMMGSALLATIAFGVKKGKKYAIVR